MNKHKRASIRRRRKAIGARKQRAKAGTRSSQPVRGAAGRELAER
jgi:hypothetical protein